MISVEGLVKVFKKKEVLNNISFTIKKSEVVGLIGDNGSGKSTLLKVICGLIHQDSGIVRINNMTNRGFNYFKIMKNIGVVFEGSRSLYWQLKVIDNINYFGSNKGLTKNNISNKLKELSRFEGLDITPLFSKYVKEISFGQKQKVALIISLLHNPDILILDEPFNGLDRKSQELLSNIILEIREKYGTTILVSSHIDNELMNFTDKFINFSEGNIVSVECLSKGEGFGIL